MGGIILNIVKCVLIIFYYFDITMSVERTNKGIKKYEDIRIINLDKLTYSIPKPQELQEIKGFLEKLTAQEQEPSKTTITQKVNFNTKSQNQDKSRNF